MFQLVEGLPQPSLGTSTINAASKRNTTSLSSSSSSFLSSLSASSSFPSSHSDFHNEANPCVPEAPLALMPADVAEESTLATIRAALDGRDPERRLLLLQLLYGEYAAQVTSRSAAHEGFQPCAKRTHRTVRDMRMATDPAGAAPEGDRESIAAEEFVDLSMDELVHRSLTLVADHWGMVDWDRLELDKLLVEIQRLRVGATTETSASPALLETASALAASETGERRSTSSSSLEIMFPTFAQLNFAAAAPCYSAESPDHPCDDESDDGSASDDDREEDGDSTSEDDYGDVQSEAAEARDMDLWISDLDELVSDLEMLSRSSSLAASDSLERSDGSSLRSFDSR